MSSPRKEAKDFPIGTIRVGKDGGDWIVNKDLKWERKKNPDKICLVGGEFSPEPGREFLVPKTFFNKFIKDEWPQYLGYRSKEDEKKNIVCCGAYVFGYEYPLDEYVRWSRYQNEGGLCCIWKVDPIYEYIIFDKIKKSVLQKEELDISELPNEKNELEMKEFVRQSYPKNGLVFIGETPGGDVGYHIYLHYDEDTKEIDSFILDVCYYNDES